MEYAHKHWS